MRGCEASWLSLRPFSARLHLQPVRVRQVPLRGGDASTSKAAEAVEEEPIGSVEGVSVKKTVNNYSWDELSLISDAMGKCDDKESAIKIAAEYNLCDKDGQLDGSKTKDVQLNNDVKAAVRIIGLYHDTCADADGEDTKAGLTFQFTTPIEVEDGVWGNDQWSGGTGVNGDQANSNAHLMCNGDKYLPSLLPDSLLNAIKPVKKSFSILGSLTATFYGSPEYGSPEYETQLENWSLDPNDYIKSCTDKMFILSVSEVFGDVSDSYPEAVDKWIPALYEYEGTQYDYYQQLNPNFSGDVSNLLPEKGALAAVSKEDNTLEEPATQDYQGSSMLRSPYGITEAENGWNGCVVIDAASGKITGNEYTVDMVPAFCI